MQGMSERQYAAHVGLSRGAIQKAKTAERLVLYPDGSINAAASDARRAETTDPSKTRKPPTPKLKPVPEAAVAAVGFLGAGTIFRSREGGLVSGITTAASLLMVAVIGIAAGVHAHLLAVGATALTLLVLLLLGWIERRSKPRESTASPDTPRRG